MTEVRRVLAPNSGLFTGPGTNTWVVVAGDEAAVIDPGPVIAEHQAATMHAVSDFSVVAVAVTHTHPDHAPAANPLAGHWNVPAYGFGPGPGFRPDRKLADGDTIAVGGDHIRAVHTPGHTPDHLCYLAGRRLFSGDHIMGGSTVVIEDLAAYLDSLRTVIALHPQRIHPGHGPDIEDPVRVAREYLDHRLEREMQIIAALRDGASTVGGIVEAVYVDVPRQLHAAAALSVGAHLRKLSDEGRVALPLGTAEWQSPVGLIEEAD